MHNDDVAEDVPASDQLPPDAAARDAAKRAEAGKHDEVLTEDEFVFRTRHLSDDEKAAVIALLTQLRTEDLERARSVERRERQPWARSQRVVEGIGDFLAEG